MNTIHCYTAHAMVILQITVSLSLLQYNYVTTVMIYLLVAGRKVDIIIF